ncbi:unnamed protein product [Ectocarpus fasciculatus]
MTDIPRPTLPLRLGDTVPNFTQNTTDGPIDFHEWIEGSWVVLCSHPKAYTPVCTTELGFMAGIAGDFEQRNTKIIAISCDSVEDNNGWKSDIAEVTGHEVKYPIISDADRHVSILYNMLMEDEHEVGMPATVRSVFIIGPDKKLKLTLTYPPSTGRNFAEIIRVLDSLQLTMNKKLATPVNWEPGQKCVVLPSVSNEDANAQYGSFEAPKPYIRFVNAPSSK